MQRIVPPFVLAVLFMTVVHSPVVAQQTVQCGDIIKSEFTEVQQQIDFAIEATPGDQIRVSGAAIGDALGFNLAILNPVGQFIATSYYEPAWSDAKASPSIDSGVLSARGTYVIAIFNGVVYDEYFGRGYNNPIGSVGAFTLSIGCTLHDGTVIQPGSTISAAPEAQTVTIAQQPMFSGFGFPGVVSVDFSAGIEIPLALGQIQTAPLASDVALYTYAASVGEVATLSLSRVSGDISIGVTVIHKDTNEIVFLGGMPSSNNLSVELTFLAGGTYAIGLFRLDTAERSATSGAVQVVLQ